MKKTRFTESQIVSILQKQEKGIKISDICREHGISDATFFNWKSKHGGLLITDAKKMQDIEAENVRLKRMYADLSIVNDALKELIEKKL